MSLTVNGNKCPQNHRCPALGVCPVDAISQDGFGLPKVDPETCIDCMACQDYCQMGAFDQAGENRTAIKNNQYDDLLT